MVDQLSLEELNRRASQLLRESSQGQERLIVNVCCKGESKKIQFNTKHPVAEANELCRNKFKFIDTTGFCLHLGFPTSVQLKPETELWKYKLKFNDELDFKLPKGAPKPSKIQQIQSSPAHAQTLPRNLASQTKQTNQNSMTQNNSISTQTQQNGNKNDEIQQLKQQLSKLQQENEDTQLLFMAEKEKTEKLQSALIEAKNNNAAMVAISQSNNSDQNSSQLINQLQNQINQLNMELTTKNAVIADLQSTVDKSCEPNATSSDADLQQRHNQLQAENTALSQRAIDLEDRLQKMVVVVKKMMEQNKTLKSRASVNLSRQSNLN
mmetsp:Transcript_1279/g.2233  ORF Transcript_1279/g.2233 Transcript_1279/m.2233 type:complete len:323 (-) Transcript_1279:11-979(-)